MVGNKSVICLLGISTDLASQVIKKGFIQPRFAHLVLQFVMMDLEQYINVTSHAVM